MELKKRGGSKTFVPDCSLEINTYTYPPPYFVQYCLTGTNILSICQSGYLCGTGNFDLLSVLNLGTGRLMYISQLVINIDVFFFFFISYKKR